MNTPSPLLHLEMDALFEKFTHRLIKDGKKTKAGKILSETFLILQARLDHTGERKNQNQQVPLFWLVSRALENVTPSLEVRKVRVAGSTYVVPAVLSKKKQETLALKWLVESARKRREKAGFPFPVCLADEIADAFRKTGGARQKRDELHRLAQLNRAYVRYRWW